MANVNEKILREGTIVTATKLPTITIGIGQVSKLKELNGTIWKDADGRVIIATKEAPNGCLYEQSRTAVVRIIGGKVKINGLFDIYAPDDAKAHKLLANPFDLDTLPSEQLDEISPILRVASEVRPSIAPAEYGRRVIVITKNMLCNEEYINCHCSWDPDDILTKLYEGDVFVIEDEGSCTGYRIGKDEFDGTHKLELKNF